MAVTAVPLTADRDMTYRGAMHYTGAKAKANTAIFAGSLVSRDASGYICPATDATGYTFAGICRTHVNAVNDGTHPTVELIQDGDHLLPFNSSTITEGSASVACYVADDNSVDVAGETANDLQCGVLVEYVDSTHGFVRIDGYAK